MTDKLTEELALRLQQLRQMHGLSQRELAKRAGVTNSSVSMIEQGRVSPSISSLEKLLQAIPISLKDFFTIDPNKQHHSFFRNRDMLKSSEKGIDSYCLAKKLGQSELTYRVFMPGSDTGPSMLIAKLDTGGFIVRGTLEVMINNECQNLEAGDGFFVEALCPYRMRNRSTEKVVLVSY